MRASLTDILARILARKSACVGQVGGQVGEGGAENAGVENAGVEIAREDSRGGNCRSGKYGRENVWKTVRTENKKFASIENYGLNKLKVTQ